MVTTPVCRNVDSASTSVVILVMIRPGQLALVEVQAQPLQLREQLDPQGVQQPLAVAPDHHRLGAMLTTQSASTMASPMSETSTISWKALASTPLSMPLRTSAGSASPASASRPSRISPMTRATASGRSSLRSVKCRSAARAFGTVHLRHVPGRRQRGDLGQQFR